MSASDGKQIYMTNLNISTVQQYKFRVYQQRYLGITLHKNYHKLGFTIYVRIKATELDMD